MAVLKFLSVSLIYVFFHYALCKLNVGQWQMLAGSFPHLLGVPVCFPASNSCWGCKNSCGKRSLKSLQPRCGRRKEEQKFPFLHLNTADYVQSRTISSDTFSQTVLLCPHKSDAWVNFHAHISIHSLGGLDCSSCLLLQRSLMTSYNYGISHISFI